jgi:hypothetical protein
MKNSIFLESGHCYKAKWNLYNIWFILLDFNEKAGRILILCDDCENDGFLPGEIVLVDLDTNDFLILEKY